MIRTNVNVLIDEFRFSLVYSNNKTSNVHHSLSECSLLHQPAVPNNEIDLNTTNERKTPLSRRILTNGLLLSPTTRRFHEPLTVKFENEDKFPSDTSSSSELLSSSDEKLLSRSEYLLRKDEQTSQQRKASSLKSILVTPSQTTSNILYPIDFDTHQRRISWQQKRSSDPYRMPIFDSGIIIDVRPTSISSIDEVCLSKYLSSDIIVSVTFRLLIMAQSILINCDNMRSTTRKL